MPERDAYEVLEVHPKARQLVIQPAYRILAGEYHPDRDPSPGANRRMVELNAAYEAVRTVDRRAVYDIQRTRAAAAVPIVMGYAEPRPRSRESGLGSNVVDFGRYAGWTLEELNRQDPEYLRFLSRHSSGIRYRRRIEQLMARRAEAAEERR